MSERVYEVLFVAEPGLAEADVDTLASQVQGVIEKEGGRVQKLEKWGKKRLAYPVGRHREGYYVLLVVEGGSGLVREVERRMKVTDGIFRYLSVRVDEDLRKAERSKARRAAAETKRRERQGSKSQPAAEEGL